MKKNEAEESRRVATNRLAERHFRFFAELVLFSLFLAGIWVAESKDALLFYRAYDNEWHFRLPYEAWIRFYAQDAVLCLGLIIVYYGTSFEVTPLRLGRPILRMLSEFVSIGLEGKRRTRREGLGFGGQDPDQPSDDGDDLAGDEQAGEPSLASTVDEILHNSARSSALLARKMERRINTHLFLGVIVGGVGLGVW